MSEASTALIRLVRALGSQESGGSLYMPGRFTEAVALQVSHTGFWVSLQVGSCFCTARPLRNSSQMFWSSSSLLGLPAF